MVLSRFLIVAMILSAVLVSGTASAQDGAPAAAQVQFKLGKEAMARMDYNAACGFFRESDRLDPAQGTRINLALCESKRGRVATAWELYTAIAESPKAGQSLRDEAREQAALLKQRIPILILKRDGAVPPDVRVVIVELSVELTSASFGQRLPLDPGSYVLAVTAPDHEPRNYNIEMRESVDLPVRVKPGPRKAAPQPTKPPEKPPSDGESSAMLPAGIAVGALGVALLVMGIVTGVIALDEKSIGDDNCFDETQTCNQDGFDANKRARRLQIASTIGFVAGGAAVGTGVLLIALDATADPVEGSASAQLWLRGSF